MDERDPQHDGGGALRAWADAQGSDPETLERERPAEALALEAREVLRAAPALAELAGGMLLAAFPRRQAFRTDEGGWVRLLAYPPLTDAELERFDALLAPLVDRPEWRRRDAYYRQVDDVGGRRRELALPRPPDAYDGGDAVVGPFPDRGSADAWGTARVEAPRVHDAFPMNGRWFCDVFRGDEGAGPAR